MKKITLLAISFVWLTIIKVSAQDTSVYKLNLKVPIIDIPQNFANNKYNISMNQSLEISNDFYELGFWGIEAIGDRFLFSKNKLSSKKKKVYKEIFNYGLGFGFSKYASELPIPLGVWAHEEYHRSILSVNKISSKNGNWILNRWDGTVYGLEDSTLSKLKSNNLNELLYSYVAGVQYEIALNEKNTLDGFYKNRSIYKNPLLLYNSLYVYNYFKFSSSDVSDSVKIIAPEFESKNPSGRDFAGADLTAWVYDMFNPNEPFGARDTFPNGDGVNRRIGFSDLSSEAQQYLKKQTNLSLLNFINPGILLVNKIRLNENLSFNFFMQYAPTHFGNDIALILPIKYKKYDLMMSLHQYSNKSSNTLGLGMAVYNYKINDKLGSDLSVNIWKQPKSFIQNTYYYGGNINLSMNYMHSESIRSFITISGKTKGWVISNPYLQSNISAQIGLMYSLRK